MPSKTAPTKHLTPAFDRDARSHLTQIIATAHRRVHDDDVGGMEEFVTGLNTVRNAVTPAEWGAMINNDIAPHPIRPKLHEDPFTRRAYEKPRGYPGDAPLLDLIYGDVPPSERPTPFGERLHRWAGTQPACSSVKERRRILASLIDQIAAEHPMPRIFSLACGHLREAQASEAVRGGAVREFVAVDQDTESLALIEREQRKHRVTPVHLTVRRFLTSPTSLGSFDLVYAAGLYDYLEERVAAALTKAMFSALRPGGTLLVANFAPELRDIGYMEAIMDWNLIYRTEVEVARFVSGIPAGEIAQTTITRDSGRNVIYLSLRKA
jgi:extracellular factor (EF) 3-hydroxypalmitic acid methyl ester biosynthesis protein